MLKFTDIDFNAVWQETFGWNAAGDTDNRKFNDQAENDFWVRLAPRYTQEYNLNHDTGLITDKLAGLLGRNKTILEIGCVPKVSAIFARRQANGKILQLTLYSTTSSVSIHSTVSAT